MNKFLSNHTMCKVVDEGRKRKLNKRMHQTVDVSNAV